MDKSKLLTKIRHKNFTNIKDLINHKKYIIVKHLLRTKRKTKKKCFSRLLSVQATL